MWIRACARSANLVNTLCRRALHSADPAEAKVIELVASSLRVERIAASGLGLARRSVEFSFLRGLLYLNGEVVSKKSYQVEAGDVIDVRSDDVAKANVFGRVVVVRIGDVTSKGNRRLTVARAKHVAVGDGCYADSVQKWQAYFSACTSDPAP